MYQTLLFNRSTRIPSAQLFSQSCMSHTYIYIEYKSSLFNRPPISRVRVIAVQSSSQPCKSQVRAAKPLFHVLVPAVQLVSQPGMSRICPRCSSVRLTPYVVYVFPVDLLSRMWPQVVNAQLHL